MRGLRLMVAVAVAALLSATLPVAAASAGPPPITGYVWGYQPANPSYMAASGYEYNSAGGPIQILRPATGVYKIKFIGLAGVGGVAHASAYGSTAICVVSSYGPSGADEWVVVRCFTNTGAPVDTRFVANVTNRRPAGNHFGYLLSDDPTPPAIGYTPPAATSYDSGGKPIHVVRTAAGHYEVTLSAFAADSAALWVNGFIAITAYGTAAIKCQMFDPAVVATDRIVVACYDDTGFAADAAFTLTYARGVSPLGGATGFATATVDHYGIAPFVKGATNTFGGGAGTSDILDTVYEITFPLAGAPRGHAVASIIGTPPMYCVIESWWAAAGTEHLILSCHDGDNGDPNPAVLYNVGFIA
jgi:hypothetical protein